MILYLLKSIPYYNSIKQEYTNILTINKPASGPLSSITTRIRVNKLSPFEVNTSICSSPDCVFAITKLNGCNELMCIDEIPDLFEFLLNNGYSIDSNITKIIQKTNAIRNGEIICMIQY